MTSSFSPVEIAYRWVIQAGTLLRAGRVLGRLSHRALAAEDLGRCELGGAFQRFLS
jgi:hypothetical protein